MAETPEAKVKRWLYDRLKKLFPEAYIYKPPGGQFGVAGTPDCFLLWRGVFVAVEVKAEGNAPTPIQLVRLRHIAAQDGVAAVVVGRDEAKLQAIYREVMDRVQRHESARSVQ